MASESRLPDVELTMQLHIPTLFVVIITTSAILALSLGAIIRRDDQDGLLPLISALGLVVLAFLLFPLRGLIPDLLSLWLAYVAVSGAFALMLRAVAAFQQRRLPAWMKFGPTLVLATVLGIAFKWLSVSLFGRIVLSNFVFLFQATLLLRILIQGTRKTIGRGQYLVIAGVLLNVVAIVARGIILYTTEMQSVINVTDPGVSQSIIFLSSFAHLILVTIGFVLMVKERADDKNRRLAVTDSLTGSWNRIRIGEYAQLEMQRRKRYDIPASILMMDLDFFKAVNDRHGHAVGDQLLREFSLMVRGCLREGDHLGRWGGEEFIVLLSCSNAATAAAIGERIRKTVATTTFADNLHITISLGYAEYRSEETLEQWVERADTALYQAKNAGRNRVEPHRDLNSPAAERASLDLIRLIWKPEYETGYARIDEQHKEFFRQGNGLLDAILRQDSPERLRRRIEAFLTVVEVHFRAEEDWLIEQNWPDSAEHAAHHKELSERAAELLAKHDQNPLDADDFLHFFINELILQHLLIDDRKFAHDLNLRAEPSSYAPNF
ncbi:MAG: diguanylate cyclase [Proteobacteria bacterium]|nr:diguanylate cyclase [Pseudomonadota bacterium]